MIIIYKQKKPNFSYYSFKYLVDMVSDFLYTIYFAVDIIEKLR